MLVELVVLVKLEGLIAGVAVPEVVVAILGLLEGGF